MIITPPAILSYPSLLTPRLGPNPKPGEQASYGCTLLFPVGTDISELKKAATAALYERFGDKTDALFSSGVLRTPFRKVDGKYDPAKYSVFINVSSKQTKPGLVDRYAGPDGRPAPLSDPEKLYPGCFVKAALSVYAYDSSGNRGVAFGLQHIQWWADGERLDNRKGAQDAFSAESRPEGDMSAMSGGPKAEAGSNLADLIG